MDEESTGSEFRTKAEAAFAEVKALRSELAATVASGFTLVNPDDLKDVAPDQFKSKAAEVEAARKQEGETLLRKTLESRGVAATDLDKVLATITAGGTPAPEAQKPNPFPPLGSLGGGPPISYQPEVSGVDRVKLGLKSKSHNSLT